MKCSFGIFNFLEDISSLSHSIVFLYYFALITEEGFLISPCYSSNYVFKWIYLSFSPLLFDDSMDVGNLISGSSAFSKSSLNIRKFTVHVLLKPGMENFEHYFAGV